MYDVKSSKAEEFISDEEILDTLDYAEKNKSNKELIEALLQKAASLKGLTHREAAVLLLSPARSVSLLEIWSGVLPLEKRPMPLWKRISFNVRKKRTRSRHGF